MNEPTVNLCDLPEAAVALLRAVHDALDIPLPGLSDEDERAYHLLLQHRTSDVRVIVADVLGMGHDIGHSAQTLSAWTSQEPVTYTAWDGGGGAP
ncbi:hypothetical protein ACH4PU_01845 [Streptomyces sp. NPDC021100]|uniref:hypothetical protein n=1 Tax=Streptomyces sp. NPDC021100 TaxID=3365114 RepID=UPI0037A06FC1